MSERVHREKNRIYTVTNTRNAKKKKKKVSAKHAHRKLHRQKRRVANARARVIRGKTKQAKLLNKEKMRKAYRLASTQSRTRACT